MKKYIPGLVSVIIPTYNLEKYIEDTILSVKNQTYRNMEIIAVDDCSTDNTFDILKKIEEENTLEDIKISCFRLEKNSGAGVVRNTALRIAKGQYVAFLDGDDWWYPEKTEKQMNLMAGGRAFSYTAVEMMNEEGNLIKGKRAVKNFVDYKFLLKNTMIATSTVIIDRTIIGDFYMPLRRSGQDYAAWLSILRGGIVAYGINEALVRYRRCSNSLSSRKYRNIKKVWDIQVHDEGIGKWNATVNSLCYAYNGLRKYYM